MAIDPETIQSGLAALTVATAELMEDMHLLAVSSLLLEPAEQEQQIAMLKQTGHDIVALAEAALLISAES